MHIAIGQDRGHVEAVVDADLGEVTTDEGAIVDLDTGIDGAVTSLPAAGL